MRRGAQRPNSEMSPVPPCAFAIFLSAEPGLPYSGRLDCGNRSSMRWQKYHPPREAAEILTNCKRVTIASTTQELIDLACGGPKSDAFEVAYEVPGKGRVVEANVARMRNGVAANYLEPYMRRRDPDCMVIGDNLPTNKETYKEKFGTEFAQIRQETFDWLETQDLVMFGFQAGAAGMGMDALVI